MRVFVFALTLFVCFSISAQWRFSLTYFADTTYFNGGQSHNYDATDFFSGWIDFARLSFAYRFSEKGALDGWIDIDDSFSPKSYKLGYQRWHSDHFYTEVAAMNQALFSMRFDDDNPNSGTGKFFNIGLIGVGGGARKSFGILEVSSSVHLLKGFSVQDGLRDLLISDSNLRTLRTQDFKMSNVWSTNMEVAAVVNIFQREKLSGGLMYKLVWRRDRFDYSNEVHIYEWTLNNEVNDEIYNTSHVFDHIQHQVGFLLKKK